MSLDKISELNTEQEIEGTSKVSKCLCLRFQAYTNILKYYQYVGNPLKF